MYMYPALLCVKRRPTVEHEHVRHVCVLPCDEVALPGFGDVVEAGCKVRMQAGFILMKATADCRKPRQGVLVACLFVLCTAPFEVVAGSSKMKFGEVIFAFPLSFFINWGGREDREKEVVGTLQVAGLERGTMCSRSVWQKRIYNGNGVQ